MFRKKPCSQIQPLLWDYAMGRLETAPHDLVARHLQDPACSACLHQYRLVADAARKVADDAAVPVEAPRLVWSEIVPRVKPSRRRGGFVLAELWLAWGIAVAGLFVLLLTLVATGERGALLAATPMAGPVMLAGVVLRRRDPRDAVDKWPLSHWYRWAAWSATALAIVFSIMSVLRGSG